MLQLISSKWGPCSVCKSSQLPACTLCCMLMKFPLFPIRRALSPHPPQPPRLPSHSPLLPTCFYAHLALSPLLIQSSCQPLALHLQQNFKIEDEEDLRHDFERLQQAMEMVGFLPATKKQWVKPSTSPWLFVHRNNVLADMMKRIRSWSYIFHSFQKWIADDFFCLFGYYKQHQLERNGKL